MLRHSLRIRLLNDSTYPLRRGESGGMEDRAVRVPAQLDIASLMNSGALFDLSIAGAPRTATRSSRSAVSRSAVVDRVVSPADALPGAFVDDRADLDRPILLVGIELEVHRLHYVRRVRCRRVDARRSDAFASTLLQNAQALVTPEAVDLLAVDAPALGARRDTPAGTRKARSQSRNTRSGSATVSTVSTVSGRRYAKRERPTRRYAICSLTGTVLIR